MIRLIPFITTETLRGGRLEKANPPQIITARARVPGNRTISYLPIILESQSHRKLWKYSPRFVDNCLRKCIGAYLSCAFLGNGNLKIKCSIAQLMKTLLSSNNLSNRYFCSRETFLFTTTFG